MYFFRYIFIIYSCIGIIVRVKKIGFPGNQESNSQYNFSNPSILNIYFLYKKTQAFHIIWNKIVGILGIIYSRFNIS